MRFWNVQKGSVKISDEEISQINTANLREMESFVTQETHLFHDSIKNNQPADLKVGRCRRRNTSCLQKGVGA